jgi:hypothetical protein
VQLVEMHKDGCPWKTRQCDGELTSFLLKHIILIISSVYLSCTTTNTLFYGEGLEDTSDQARSRHARFTDQASISMLAIIVSPLCMSLITVLH